MNREIIFENLLEAINQVKNTGFSVDNTELDFYLGGDLGVDSVEMLEIWYDLENALDVSVADGEKRDLYTLEDVVRVLEVKLGVAQRETASGELVNFARDEVDEGIEDILAIA